MHIKDHSAAMKFFRTYDNVASKGKWKEFVNEMEFDSVVQEPRTMAHGGRPGYQSGQLVDHGPGRQGYKRGNITTHPVKPLTKDQKKIYDMMLSKELPTNRPSVAERLVERFNKPWEKLDSVARANFIHQTYPRYKKLLERSEGKITRNQLADILSEKLGRPISLTQLHGYGGTRAGVRKKTEFSKKLDEILDVTRVTPKNPMYKIPTDSDIKKLTPLLDITPSNSLKNLTADNIVKLNKKYAGMYKSGKLPSLETVLKDFPNMTSTQAGNATIRLSQIYSGNKFKLFSNLNPQIKKAVENIKVNKKLGDKVFKLIGGSKFNEYRSSMYRISLGIIDEKLGNKKGTFESLKLKARNILKENKIPIYSPEKKNAAGKIIQKAKPGFNINEIAGVSGSAKSKAAEFSQFVDVMEGNLNQKTMANFQSKLSSARQIIENNPSMLASESKKINKLALNLEEQYDVELPRLKDSDATKYFSSKRLQELKDQGLDIAKASERAGYTVQMPKSAKTIKEFVTDPKATKSLVAKILKNSGLPCALANGINCSDPRAYIKSINELKAKAALGDKAAFTKFKKVANAMRKFKGAAAFTGWGLLGEIGFALPFAAMDYADGKSTAQIMNEASFGLFGMNEEEEAISLLPKGSQGGAVPSLLRAGEKIDRLTQTPILEGPRNEYLGYKERIFPKSRMGMDQAKFKKAQAKVIPDAELDFKDKLEPFLEGPRNEYINFEKANKASEDIELARSQLKAKEEQKAKERAVTSVQFPEFKEGGRVSYFDGGIVSLKKKW
jgi:hypothetical protein